MMDLKRLSRMPYITKRIYILENICQFANVDLEYLFGLFNLYNNKNRGKWFWQKAAFTGVLKEDYNYFNMVVDKIINDLKEADEKKTKEQIKSASEKLDKFLADLETDCNVDRKNDFNKVKGFLDKNLKALITDNLKRIE
jgi:hypothetical protein